MKKPSERIVERTTTVAAPPALFLMVDRGLELIGLAPDMVESINELVLLAWPLAVLGVYAVMDHLGLRKTRNELEAAAGGRGDEHA